MTVAVVAVVVSVMLDETEAVTVREKVVEVAVAHAPKATSVATPKAVAAKAAVKNVGHAEAEVDVAANVTANVTASAKAAVNSRSWVQRPWRRQTTTS